MTPYACKVITLADQITLQKVKYLMNIIPDIDIGKDGYGEDKLISCHMVCRAIAKKLGLQYEDGYWYSSYEHSWIITDNYNIIDAYPVGTIGGSILVPWQRPWTQLYSAARLDVVQTDEFENDEEIIYNYIKDIDINSIRISNDIKF